MSIESLPARIKSLWHRWLHGQEVDSDLEDEIRSQLALMTDQKIKEGMAPDQARRAAVIDLGGIEQVKEQVRAVRTGAWLDSSIQDIRFALRMLRKNPGFTTVAVLTLALGIGANTAMFSVIDAVLLRPFPYEHSDRILLLFGGSLDTGNFSEWHSQATSYDRFAAVSITPALSTVNGESEQLTTLEISTDFFPLLGFQPALGRPFVESDFQSANGAVAIMSDRLWRTSFDSDPKILGRVLLLGKLPFTIVGVLPPDPGPLPYQDFDLLLPLGPERARGTEVLARLKPGVTIEAARVEAATLAERLANPSEKARAPLTPLIRVAGFKDQLVEDSRLVLLLLGGAVALVLLIACVNIANLQLVRFARRKREIAVRCALGASRARLVRQMLIEGVILAGIGAIAGILIARSAMSLLIASIPFYVPRLAESRIDASVLLFVLFLAAVSTILSGLIPAWGVSNVDAAPALKGEVKSGSSTVSQRRLRGSFVLAEVALSTVMLAGAALLVRTFVVLRPSNPGFDPNNKLIINIRIRAGSPTSPDPQIAVLRDALNRMNAIPGLRSVAAVSDLPMTGNSYIPQISIDGRAVAGLGTGVVVHYRASTANFFRVMRMPLVSGRDFTAADDEHAPKVAIVNQTMASRFWPGANPIGQRLTLNWADEPVEFTVIGVVRDARIFAMETSSRPELYVPFWQDPKGRMSFVVLGSYDPEALVPAVRETLRPLGNGMVVTGFDTMTHFLYDSVGEPRFNAQLFGTLALLAFVLAIVGIYGVISYSVAQRTHEIGIRMALGATPGQVTGLFVVQGLRLTLIGLVVGILAGLVLTRIMSSLLFGVSAGGPLLFVAFTILLLGITTVACYIPARRATHVDPVSAMRYE